MSVAWEICPHFGDCGGCSYQDMPYEEQLRMKAKAVRNALGGAEFSGVVVEDPLAPGPPLRYRNKMEFTFGPDGSLGLHRRGDFRSIIPLQRCLLPSEDMETVLQRVSVWSREWGLSGYDKRAHRGLLRHLSVRSSADGDLLVSLFTSREELDDVEERALGDLGNYLDGLPVRGLLWIVNPAKADAARTDEGRTEKLSGSPEIMDRLAGFDFKIGVDTFFQINLRGAEKLIELVRDFSWDPAGGGAFFDVFSGVGTFSLPLARDFAPDPVVGIEIVTMAVESARENARRNGLSNAHFLESDARRGLPLAQDLWGVPGRVVLDPPRSGAGGKVMRKIGRTGARKIVYVSCNPESFAVDARQLMEFGYRIDSVVPVDMFPQTEHVECVVSLVLAPG